MAWHTIPCLRAVLIVAAEYAANAGGASSIAVTRTRNTPMPAVQRPDGAARWKSPNASAPDQTVLSRVENSCPADSCTAGWVKNRPSPDRLFQ